MACCGRRKKPIVNSTGVMGGYANLTDRQIRARLEVYKKKYCPDEDCRYKCDYTMYTECKKSKG